MPGERVRHWAQLRNWFLVCLSRLVWVGFCNHGYDATIVRFKSTWRVSRRSVTDMKETAHMAAT